MLRKFNNCLHISEGAQSSKKPMKISNDEESTSSSEDHFYDICSEEFEYSVNPAKESNCSIINAKSVGSKSKAHNDTLAKIDQHLSEKVKNLQRGAKQTARLAPYGVK